MNDLFTAVGDATGEAICNALVAARGITGIEGNSVRACQGRRRRELAVSSILLYSKSHEDLSRQLRS